MTGERDQEAAGYASGAEMPLARRAAARDDDAAYRLASDHRIIERTGLVRQRSRRLRDSQATGAP